MSFLFFFFNDTATTEIYTLSLHDALPISNPSLAPYGRAAVSALQKAGIYEQVKAKLVYGENISQAAQFVQSRSEEHTSELQSQSNLVCRLLLEKKKTYDVIAIFQ